MKKTNGMPKEWLETPSKLPEDLAWMKETLKEEMDPVQAQALLLQLLDVLVAFGDEQGEPNDATCTAVLTYLLKPFVQFEQVEDRELREDLNRHSLALLFYMLAIPDLLISMRPT